MRAAAGPNALETPSRRLPDVRPAQAAVEGEIDLIVRRGTSTYLPLVLKPGEWDGEGLLGAKMGVPE